MEHGEDKVDKIAEGLADVIGMTAIGVTKATLEAAWRKAITKYFPEKKGDELYYGHPMPDA